MILCLDVAASGPTSLPQREWARGPHSTQTSLGLHPHPVHNRSLTPVSGGLSWEVDAALYLLQPEAAATAAITTGPPPLQTFHWTFRVATVILTYVLPTIVLAGLLGNGASFLVFLGRDMRKLSSSVYVTAALTSDTCQLVAMLFVWLEVLGIRLNHENGACQFLVFLTYASSFLSVWYTVCITVENYIAICHPTRVKTLCTRRRATVVVSLLAVVSLPLYVVSAAASEVLKDPDTGLQNCGRKQDAYGSAMRVLTFVDSVITLLLPLVCVTVMLAAITLSIIKTCRWRRSSPGSQKQRAELMKIPQVRVAKMLFVLSLSFLIMTSPSHISRLYYLVRLSLPGGKGAPGGAESNGVGLEVNSSSSSYTLAAATSVAASSASSSLFTSSPSSLSSLLTFPSSSSASFPASTEHLSSSAAGAWKLPEHDFGSVVFLDKGSHSALLPLTPFPLAFNASTPPPPHLGPGLPVSEISQEEGLLQLVLEYGSYCYHAVKFILFLSFSKNFRRTIRQGCARTVVLSPRSPCVKKHVNGVSSPAPV